MENNIKIYFLFDKVAQCKGQCFLNSSDDAAIRMLKNDIYKLMQEADKNSVLLTRIADSVLYKITVGDQPKVDLVKDLKDFVPFTLDLTKKAEEVKNGN